MKTRNKALIITGVGLLIVALIAFVLGGWFAGWDFGKFFSSPTFGWICVLLCVYAVCAAALLIWDRIENL